VSTTLAGIFLRVVSKYRYLTVFFLFSTFIVIYLLTVTFFLPETKGKTLEEIERYFETGTENASLKTDGDKHGVAFRELKDFTADSCYK
jgi:hypothetical protein